MRAALAFAAGALGVTLLLGLVALGAARGAASGSAGQAGQAATVPSAPPGAPDAAAAQAQVPAEYLSLYRAAAARYGLDWAILAGIGKVECDHGRDPDPACTQEGAVNSAGAGGPMQFLASTWARYGLDGDGDGRSDRWDPADAIPAAARYLRAAGAPGDYEKAILAYNHAGWYVSEVEHWAALYRAFDATAGGTPGVAAGGTAAAGAQGAPAEGAPVAWDGAPAQFVAGARARLSPTNGHVALVPAEAPPAVQAMVIAGNELQDLPYGAAGHPDPRGALSEDCSSTLNYVLFRAGVRPIAEIVRENPLAQDYVRWGLPGPGRWVSIYATTSPSDHVFVTIAGLRLDTSHNGTDLGPNRAQDGPRWRVLGGIPGWARWSVRHPPGL